MYAVVKYINATGDTDILKDGAMEVIIECARMYRSMLLKKADEKEWAGLVYIGGTHPASEGGAWIVAVNGFAGIKINDGKLICNLNLPKNWSGMHFKLLYKEVC